MCVCVCVCLQFCFFPTYSALTAVDVELPTALLQRTETLPTSILGMSLK